MLIEHLERAGPIGFDDYVAHALYAPGLGFYTSGGGAGRRRDFLTSPEVGPLFGVLVGRALDRWWDELWRPDPFLVVEAGAGPGTLARTVFAARPACLDALQLVLVEPGDSQWATHPDRARSRHHLPEPGELGPGPVIVLANELLDNLPFGLVELRPPSPADPDGTWSEVVVDVGSGSDGRARLVEAYAPLEPARQGWCWGRAGRSVPIGTRLPVQAEAAGWLAAALDLSAGGRVVALDYASTTPELARRPWDEWVRTYSRHERAGHPLEQPGSADITCEVAVDQLSLVRPPARDRSQAAFLADLGIEELVAEGRARWAEEGPAGGVAAVAARSRVHEAEALTDPAGLGAFRVLEWTTG
ncbi:MAG: hypothetical protein JWM89_3211 [Acidimicrobiales bacterium]|nr:hypothetical protein [Acidimicrobiales bacterium]